MLANSFGVEFQRTASKKKVVVFCSRPRQTWNLTQWCRANKLSIIFKKSNFMVFRPRQRRQTLDWRQRNVPKSVMHVQSCCFFSWETYCFFAVLVAVAVFVAYLRFISITKKDTNNLNKSLHKNKILPQSMTQRDGPLFSLDNIILREDGAQLVAHPIILQIRIRRFYQLVISRTAKVGINTYFISISELKCSISF